MSEVQWVGCMLGTTPRRAKRGMSAGVRIWACSTRSRGAGPPSPSTRSNTSSTSVFARSPMACTHTWKPRAVASRVSRSTSSGGTRIRPVFFESSQYGEWSAAPREPSAPSSQSLIAPTVSRPSPTDSGPPRSRYCPHAFLPDSAANTRNGNRSRPMRRLYEATAARSSPGSCAPVSPLARHSAITASTAASKRASDGGGTSPRIRSWARSMSSPVGSPPASRTMTPPAGSVERRVMPARSSAAPLAHVAWPSTRTSATGYPGAARSSEAREGQACPGQRVWSQPRPAIHSPGRRPRAARATIAAISSSEWVVARSSSSRARASSMRCPCASTSPGSTVRPPRSMTGSPAAGFTWSPPPAKATRPSRITRASTTEPAASMVWMRPLASSVTRSSDRRAPGATACAGRG